MSRCEYCHRERRAKCMNTRDMEDGDRECFDALTRAGGGEYTINQTEAMHRDEQFKLWQERRR